MADSNSDNPPNDPKFQKVLMGTFTDGTLRAVLVDDDGKVQTTGASGGTSAADDSAFTPGSTAVTPVGYFADETAPDSVDEGDVGAPRMTLSRKPYAVISDPTSENNAGVDASGHLQIDIAADSVGIGGGTEYTEGDTDATITGKAMLGEAAGDTLEVLQLDASNRLKVTLDGVAVDTELPAAAALADATSNPTAPAVASFVHMFNGTTWDRVRGSTANGVEVDVTQVQGTVTVSGTVAATQSGTWNINNISGTISLPTGAATSANQSTANTHLSNIATSTGIMDDWDNAASDGASVSGDTAHDSVDAGEPVKVGGKARTSLDTAVANNDRVNMLLDKFGRLIARDYLDEQLTNPTTTTISTTTETTILAAGGAGIKHKLILLEVLNSSNEETRVDIRDSTAGTIRLSIPVRPGGGSIRAAPLVQATANNNWTAQLSAAVTDIRINVVGVAEE